MKPPIRQAKMFDFYIDKINLGVHHFINNNYLVVKENVTDSFVKVYTKSKLKHSKDKDGNPIPIIIDEKDYKLIEDYKIVICNYNRKKDFFPIVYTDNTDHRILSLHLLELSSNESYTCFLNNNRFDCRKENMLLFISSDKYTSTPIIKFSNKEGTKLYYSVNKTHQYFFSITELGEAEALRQAKEKRKYLHSLSYKTKLSQHCIR